MTKEHEYVVFDHYLSEQLGFWFRHSPEAPLPLDVFYNLLSSDRIICFEYHMYSEDILQGRWRSELKQLISLKKLKCTHRSFEVSDDLRIDFELQGKIDIKPLGRFEDTYSFIWCDKNQLPFRLSKRGSNYINQIINLTYNLLDQKQQIENTSIQTNDILKWIVDIEIPELESRSKLLRKKAFEENVLVAENNPDFTRLLAASFWESLENSVFVTPPELLELLKQTDALESLQEVLRQCAILNMSKSDVRSHIREVWDRLLGRLEISDIAFTGIDLSLIPLNLLGPVTLPIKWGVNRFIRKQSNWLLSFNDFNKQIRKKNKN